MSTDTILTPEEIGRIAVAHGCDPGLDDGALVMRLCRAIEQAVLQSDEVQALRKDAERLDFIESEGVADFYQSEDGDWIVDTGSQFGIGGDLREAIDAAMEKQP